MSNLLPEEIDELTSQASSQSDDKTNPNFQTWRKDPYYKKLPTNVRQAIKWSTMKAKHSEFYYKLQNLNERIGIYKELFSSKTPGFQTDFLQRRKKYRELQMRQQRE